MEQDVELSEEGEIDVQEIEIGVIDEDQDNKSG